MPVVIERDQDGYFVFCPIRQGCYTQGDFYEEAMDNIQDAIQLHIADRLVAGEPIPNADMVSLATLEVKV
jgi:predicted RNase H-like HicB family nuclease